MDDVCQCENGGDAVVVSVVRFRSMLSDDEVQEAFERRAERYRRAPGLVQKIYLRFRETGEFGAIYVWETEESLREFRERATSPARLRPSTRSRPSLPSLPMFA
jgi:hypothetical protein